MEDLPQTSIEIRSSVANLLRAGIMIGTVQFCDQSLS